MEKMNVYKCAYCGKEYNKIEDRMKCEEKCHKKHEEELKRIEAERLNGERKEREKVIDELYEKCESAIHKYMDDYGCMYLPKTIKLPYSYEDTINKLEKIIDNISF